MKTLIASPVLLSAYHFIRKELAIAWLQEKHSPTGIRRAIKLRPAATVKQLIGKKLHNLNSQPA
jgi:hypothetical protein